MARHRSPFIRKRLSVDLPVNVMERLDDIASHYGLNRTAALTIAVNEKHLQLAALIEEREALILQADEEFEHAATFAELTDVMKTLGG